MDHPNAESEKRRAATTRARTAPAIGISPACCPGRIYGTRERYYPFFLLSTTERRIRVMSVSTSQRVSNYIGGASSDGSTDDVIEVVNPATAEVIGTFAASSAADVDQAVRAARAALPGWASTPPSE